MLRIAVLLTAAVAFAAPAAAQKYRVEWTSNGPVWIEVNPAPPRGKAYQAPPPFWGSAPANQAEEDLLEFPQKKKPAVVKGPPVLEGGPKPSISPAAPPKVAFKNEFGAGTIVIDTSGRALYYVLSSNEAYRYPISVGRQGFTWTGTETISRKVPWPDWRPPKEMRERKPELPELMTGGINNPLGAMALYLGNTLYRIHGTNDSKSIGYAASSGCFRMHNTHVMHLSGLAGIGTTVKVFQSLPKNVASTGGGATAVANTKAGQ
jgi:lipoprotein-anchoring transpeptidase ErfK/SrfK